MALRPLPYCVHPGCAQRVPSGRCAQHAVQQEHTRPNLEVRRWYYRQRWKHLRAQVLVDACYTCAVCGVIHPHLEVDHIVKHEGNPDLFWDRENLQALCSPCHTRKTGRGA